jgi:hypothetical protein
MDLRIVGPGAEAKNEDIKKGYAQCMAEMIAAQQFNERETP